MPAVDAFAPCVFPETLMSAPGVSASRSAAVSPVFHARTNRSTVPRIIDPSHGGSTVALVREAAGVVASGAGDVAPVQPASITRATKEAKEVRITALLLLRGPLAPARG